MKSLLHVFIYLTIFSACQKKYDQPPLRTLPSGAELEVRDLRNRLGSDNSLYHFGEGDSTLIVTIIMDESSGNIYKQVYGLDKNEQGILLKLINAGGLFAGDRIRINLNKAWLVCANSMVSIDSLDITKSIVKISSGHLILPVATDIEEIFGQHNFNDVRNFQSKLVTIPDVEFEMASKGLTLANAIGKSALEHPLGKCGGDKIYLRTSGMASFAAKTVPSGHGSITGVIQQYNHEFTLLLRNYNEIQMTGASCAPPDTTNTQFLLYKDFDDKSLNSGGWTNVNATGTTSWSTSNIGQSTYYARIYNKSNNIYEACETWLISPEINLPAASNATLNFLTANSSTASPLHLMISENYVAGPPSGALWTETLFDYQKNSFTNYPSGDISLATYPGKKIRIAFRYSGTASNGSIWNVDKISIRVE